MKFSQNCRLRMVQWGAVELVVRELAAQPTHRPAGFHGDPRTAPEFMNKDPNFLTLAKVMEISTLRVEI